MTTIADCARRCRRASQQRIKTASTISPRRPPGMSVAHILTSISRNSQARLCHIQYAAGEITAFRLLRRSDKYLRWFLLRRYRLHHHGINTDQRSSASTTGPAIKSVEQLLAISVGIGKYKDRIKIMISDTPLQGLPLPGHAKRYY